MDIGADRDVGNAVTLIHAYVEATRRLQGFDIIGMSSMSVNSVLVIMKPGQYSITARGRKQA